VVANEDPLSQGGAWSPTPISGSGLTLEVLSNLAGHNEGAFAPGDSYRSTDISGDAEVYATLQDIPDNNEPVYLYLHLQDVGGPNWDGYRITLERWVTSVADTVKIQKVLNGTATDLASTGLGNPAVGKPDLQDNDVFLLRRASNNLELWRKNSGTWKKLLSASDAAFTHGMLGLGVDDDSVRWDDFGGGIMPNPAGPPLTQSIGVCSGAGMHANTGDVGCLDGSDPVSTLSGAFIAQVDDLGTPGTGVSFAWNRSYTSSDATVGRLGPGWTDSYATSLLIQGSGDVILHGDEGQRVYYTKQGGGSFVGAPGSLSTLTSITGGFKLVRQALLGAGSTPAAGDRSCRRCPWPERLRRPAAQSGEGGITSAARGAAAVRSRQ